MTVGCIQAWERPIVITQSFVLPQNHADLVVSLKIRQNFLIRQNKFRQKTSKQFLSAKISSFSNVRMLVFILPKHLFEVIYKIINLMKISNSFHLPEMQASNSGRPPSIGPPNRWPGKGRGKGPGKGPGAGRWIMLTPAFMSPFSFISKFGKVFSGIPLTLKVISTPILKVAEKKRLLLIIKGFR